MTQKLPCGASAKYLCLIDFKDKFMKTEANKNISNFRVAGINYRKSDSAIRGEFAVNNDQYSAILAAAHEEGLDELFILSTCNRTEIYGFASDVDTLVDLLCAQTAGTKETFKKLAYIKSGDAAIEHLFTVSAGLDSQILGDYEIVGQLKIAALFAKEQGFIGAFTERLLNCTIQSSKAIRNNTQLSSGTVSVSFAAIQYIRDNVANYTDKKIILLGTGKIGRNTCKNLVDYLGTHNVTLINRSADKAKALALELGLEFAPIEEMNAQIAAADVIITSTNATSHIVTKDQFIGCGTKHIIDLSIPYNVDPAIKGMENVHLINVDELSKMKDETLQKREAEVPKAKGIIAEHIEEFKDWYAMRRNVPVLVAIKNTLKQLHTADCYDETRIQKVINTTAIKLKTYNNRGCYFIEAINDFIAN